MQESQDRSYSQDEETEEDIERNQKQDYLRNEIINVGYNPQDFAQFMQEEKEDGKGFLKRM